MPIMVGLGLPMGVACRMAGCGPWGGRTLKGARDGYRWRLCRRGCAARYLGVKWRLYLMEAAVQTHKVLVERNDPAPGRVAPDAGGRKRRCDTFVFEG